ncbi:hypothetical protein lerEdw1_018968 [Lerista edwardsae]|nr:hypothetical protein lerEdw1_018968 [Lerista edwardsae]
MFLIVGFFFLVENEEELDREFELEIDTLFWRFRKLARQSTFMVLFLPETSGPKTLQVGRALDPMDFEWSFWIEWGKEYVLWLLCGHLIISQMSSLCMEKHRPCFLMAYGMAASWFLLGINGLIVILVHVTVSYLVALFKNPILVWLSSLLLLSTLHMPALEDVKKSWYASESEYYLLLFTLTVRCLYYTSFSLEYCWHRPTESAHHSFLWMLVYVFYYPVFHNGPVITFNDFCKQVTALSKNCLGLG